MANKKLSRFSHVAAIAFASVAALSINGAQGASHFPAGQMRFANSNLLLRGPIESLDAGSSRILVLGQWIPVSATQLAASKIGQFVAVYGSLTSSGGYVVSALLHINSVRYVPGATSLYIKGLVSSADQSTGSLHIGSLSVDYSAALSEVNSLEIAKGEAVALRGWLYGGVSSFYAQSATVISPVRTASLGQTGSGAHSLGQTGSGAHSLGQTGSGAHSMGQTGSGAFVMGQTGSGAYSMGQTGSGAFVMGQTGSGAHSLGQTGSGARTMGQTGSGVVGR